MICKFEPIVLIFWDFTDYTLIYTMTSNASPLDYDIETLQLYSTYTMTSAIESV